MRGSANKKGFEEREKGNWVVMIGKEDHLRADHFKGYKTTGNVNVLSAPNSEHYYRRRSLRKLLEFLIFKKGYFL